MSDTKEEKVLSKQKIRKSQMKVRAIEIPIAKIDSSSADSKQLPEEHPFNILQEASQIIEPPFDLFTLSTMQEMNSELGPCIDSMKINIDGFGHRLISRIDLDNEDVPEDLRSKVMNEEVVLKNFFLYAGMKKSFRALRKNTRQDIESTGNGYWEVIRGKNGKIQYFEQIKSYQVRLTPQCAEPVEVKMPVVEVNRDGSFSIKNISVMKRFRRFVQVSSAVKSGSLTSGYRQRWFKEFGDPRTFDLDTGIEIKGKELESFPEEKKANEVIHFRIFCSRSPYGIPRYIGVLLSILGDRKGEEINYTTLNNNNIPSLLVMVSNGQLTDGSIERVSEYFEKLQGDDNRSKVLVIESESSLDEDGEDIGQSRMEVKELNGSQHNDAMYQEYAKGNRERIKTSFRIPPIFLGRSDDYNRSTAETARRLADEQIFNPEREEFDDFINRILFPSMGVLYHDFKSNSPNTTDSSELVKILSGSEKTGGMTPRIARSVLEDILSVELGGFTEEFDPDVPFSLTMAEAVKNKADPTEPGQQVTALKNIEKIDDITNGVIPGTEVIKKLLTLREKIEDAWVKEATIDEDRSHEE